MIRFYFECMGLGAQSQSVIKTNVTEKWDINMLNPSENLTWLTLIPFPIRLNSTHIVLNSLFFQ
jgi:hypothetical protein